MAEKIRINNDYDLASDFDNKCQQKWNDHNPILENNIEFLSVSKANDLVVTQGINQNIDAILGVNVFRWQYMGKGTGTTAPSAGQTLLVAEVLPKVDMSLFGWRLAAGHTLRFAAIFGESVPTITVNECGIFNANSMMLNRNMFSTQPLAHTVNVTGFILSSIIEFVPIVGT